MIPLFAEMSIFSTKLTHKTANCVRNNKYINTIDNMHFLVYPYFDGKILLTRELSLEHVRKLARELSKLPVSYTHLTLPTKLEV